MNPAVFVVACGLFGTILGLFVVGPVVWKIYKRRNR
jgi:hypothetical protein